MSKRPFVVNLFAGPGAGKSTVAAGVFEELKWQGVEVELVREFAKDEVWADHKKSFGNQLYLTGIQSHRQFVLRDEVDVVITDSPIILGCLYGASPKLSEALLEEFNQYNNINYFLQRTKAYNPKGRNQNAEEAKTVDFQSLLFLIDSGIPYTPLKADREAKHAIVERVLKELQGRAEE
jgi:hypothetical protein